MADNFTEAVTHVTYHPGTPSTGYFYYTEDSSDPPVPITDINLSDLEPVEDQLEVMRLFDFEAMNEFSINPPTPTELGSLYALPSTGPSGSPMYTVDTVNKRITFSTTESDYVWLNGYHHTRGGDVQLPIINTLLDTIIIRRKTVSSRPRMTWTPGTKITARSLNVQSDQLLSLAQELRTTQLNPILFDHSIGAPYGVCPLDGNGVIPLKNIPTVLGGGGILFVDLSGNVIGDLGDVNETITPDDGFILTWNAESDEGPIWEPMYPLERNIDLAEAPNQGCLLWTESTVAGINEWVLKQLSANDLQNLSASTPDLVKGSLLYYDDVTEKWLPTTVDGTLTEGHVLTWNPSDYRWEAKLRPDITYEVFNLDEVSLETLADVGYQRDGSGAFQAVDGDVLAWFTNQDTNQGRWRDQSLDSWDLNNWWSGIKCSCEYAHAFGGPCPNADSYVECKDGTDCSNNDPNDWECTTDPHPLVGDPGQPGYSNGLRAASQWHFYNTGWTPYWDGMLEQNDNFDPNKHRGSFHTGPTFAGGMDPDGTLHCDFDDADTNFVIKWESIQLRTIIDKYINSNTPPPGGLSDWEDYPGYTRNDDASRWILGALNINHLKDVHARHYNFYTNPYGGGSSSVPSNGDILVWDDGSEYDDTDPDTGPPPPGKWVLKSGVNLGSTVTGDFDFYKTTHKFDSHIDTINGLAYNQDQIGQGFAGIWMDMHRFNYGRSSLHSWAIFCNGRATCRVRLFKTNSGGWNNFIRIPGDDDVADLINLTDNTSPEDTQNNTNRVMGIGQTTGNGSRRKERNPDDGDVFYLSDDVLMGSGSPNMYKDDLLICELENFQATNGDNTNTLMLVLTWRIEAVD